MRRTTARFFRTFASATVLVSVAATAADAATVTGRVLDTTTSLPLSGAEVLVDGQSTGVTTDDAGVFNAEVAPGERLFTFRRVGFSEQSVGPVAVTEADGGTVPDAKLAPAMSDDVLTLDALTVEGALVKNSVAADRQQAAISVDLISAADFGKFTGSDVSDVVVRIPGLSISSQGSFAVVRGLAERYNPVLLQGIVMPSSDPERQNPELDIFPTKLVDAIVVSKVFSPGLPSTTSGGAVDLRTRPLPEGRAGEITFGLRADEGVFNDTRFRTSGDAGGASRFAYGSRERLDNPANDVAALSSSGSATNAFFLRDNARSGTGRERDVPLGNRVALTYEDRHDISTEKGQAFGYTLNFAYDRSASTEEGQRLDILRDGILDYGATGPAGVPFHRTTDYIESEEEVRLGGYVGLGYAFNTRHSVSASLFYSQIGADSVTEEFNGYEVDSSSDPATSYAEILRFRQITSTLPVGAWGPAFSTLPSGGNPNLEGKFDIRYRERNLTNARIGGEHDFDVGGDLKLTWAYANILASQKEPDSRVLSYLFNVNSGIYTPRLQAGSYARFWRETEETSDVGRVDLESSPDFASDLDLKLNTGVYVDRTDRAYEDFSYTTNGALISPALLATNDIESLTGRFAGLTDAQYGSIFSLPQSSTVDARRDLDAAYLGGSFTPIRDRGPVHKLEISGGVRFEDISMPVSGRGGFGNASSFGFYQNLPELGVPVDANGDGVANPDEIYTGGLDEQTFHPTIALNYSPRPQFNVRLSYAETAARPSFRELSPYFTVDALSGEVQHGNVGLRQTEVRNFDLRFEYFVPQSTDLFALSFFRKEIANPIERVGKLTGSAAIDTLGSGGVVTWANNPSDALVKGIEIEAARNLGFLGSIGEWFTLGGNATYIDAEVSRFDAFENQPGLPAKSVAYGDTRRLADQPEWILNTYLTFDHRPMGLSVTLSYFAISDVLQTVRQAQWDRFVAETHRVDLSVAKKFGRNWTVRLSARNLTDPEQKIVADPDQTDEEVVFRTFKTGRNYSVNVSYAF